MKNILTMAILCALAAGFAGCKGDRARGGDFEWIVDRFDDVKILRYKVPGFESLPLDDKLLIYYLNEAALAGRDMIFDQNFRYNLAIRRTLETIYENAKADHNDPRWAAFEKYLKKVWFANGIHHHYSGDKFVPEFTQTYFDSLAVATPAEMFPEGLGTLKDLLAVVKPAIFNPKLYAKRLDQREGIDMLAASAMNYYQGVTQAEAEAFYAGMADPKDMTPPSYGLNSKLVKKNGRLVEQVWKVGGMYSPAIEKVVFWLEKAIPLAHPMQQQTLKSLVAYYRTGDLREFDRFNVLWLEDTVSHIDFVNGFTETYGDPLGYKASWEGLVNFKDPEATKRAEAISAEAQWFEDHSPIDSIYKKETVKGVTAKVINATILGGDCYPATPIGINLPNADWIRRDHGSKSVTIQNITDAYDEVSRGSGMLEEFMLRVEDRERVKRHGALAGALHTDLHECLGHGSGKLAEGVKGDEMKNYGSTIEEARADLFALYYLADPKLLQMGIVTSPDVWKAEYAQYIMNGLMTQTVRIKPGKDIEESHMRNRLLIAKWCYEKGRANNTIEILEKDGKEYVVVNDFDSLRVLFGDMLREVQRIKSTGDYPAGRDLVENYGVKIDHKMHAQVLERYAALKLEPYAGFINPDYKPVMENGRIVDIIIDYPLSYTAQMLNYSKNYSFLPSVN
ncbi:MAG: dipeptidyl peptidase 3 [Rikenellaceae bacterium]|jgi:dipeptidyl-peptidase-3|nr:dipeptidyl peptidase 3 [Rikenellaceae bacterium]